MGNFIGNTSFLKTYELTTEILNLISSAESYCYIVSPYIKIWPQLNRILEIASEKRTILTFIIREDKASSNIIQRLNKELGFEVVVIKDLHIKLYLNEKKCLISSMNLYDASQQNNLELGCYFGNAIDIKKNILENYILSDKTAVTYKGKFEADRTAILKRVAEAQEVLKKDGYCVDCQKKMDLDFKPRIPYYVRCRDCYNKKDDRALSINFCHFCGKPNIMNGTSVLHEECEKKLFQYKLEIKHY